MGVRERPRRGQDPAADQRNLSDLFAHTLGHKIDKMAKEQRTTRAAIIRQIVMKHLGFKPKL
jgi:hypothetical protein